MMHHKVCSRMCRLCGKEKQRGTDVFVDKVKGAVLCSIINKYFPKEVINIGIADALTKYVCIDCEQKICTFDEFCLMVANVQRQLVAPSLEIDFAEDMLCHLKENESALEKSRVSSSGLVPKSKRPHACQLCDKRFRCQAHLDRHKRIHTGLRPFVCNVCSMSFNQQEILNKHKESHQGRKEFRCAHCQQSFRFKVSLKSHMINFHTESDGTVLDNIDRSLVCTECGKLFATRYKLRRHARCHTGERPYVCTYCNRTFSQTGNLKLHETKCQLNLVATCQISRLDESIVHPSLHRDHVSHNLNGNLDYCQIESSAPPITSGPSYSDVPNVMPLEAQQPSLQHFQPMYISESEIQKTINETLNSSSVDPESSAYLIKNYDNPMYIDDEIVTMLDRDLISLEASKFSSMSMQDKIPTCLKQPATPELLHSLLYDD